MNAHWSSPQLGRGALTLCGASSILKSQNCAGLSWELWLRAHSSPVYFLWFPSQFIFYGSHPQQRTMASVALTIHEKLVLDSTLPTLQFCFSLWVYFTVVRIWALSCCCFGFFNCFLPSSTPHSFGIGLPLTSCSQFLHPFCFSVPHYHDIDSKDILFLAGGFPHPLNTFNENTFLSLSYLGEKLICLYFSQNSYRPIYHPQTA